MKKYIIVGVVLVAGISAAWFVIKNGDSVAKQIADTGGSFVVAPVNPTPETPLDNKSSGADTKDINSMDNQKITKKMTTATINTNMGTITIEFFDKQAPNTVANFVKLAKSGFYDGIKFHRVIKGFMIQGGDPLTKDDTKIDMWGTGDPGYKFADEINPKSDLYVKTGYAKGIVAMANSGENTNDSQFFIMTETYPLPPSYTIFGKVTSGQDVVDKIANVSTCPGDRPLEPIVIKSISLQ